MIALSEIYPGGLTITGMLPILLVLSDEMSVFELPGGVIFVKS